MNNQHLAMLFLLVSGSLCLCGVGETLSFHLVRDAEEAAFDISPNQTRMATAYQDKVGVYHLFADFTETSTISWHAEIRYYRSKDLYEWEYVSTVVPHGEAGAPDARGCSSPHVLATDERVYLFYGGTAEPEGENHDFSAARGEPGYTSRRILLAVADADEHGAPAGAFVKRGVALEPGPAGDWDSMRLDDPCVVPDGDSLHLFYKGFDSNRRRERVRVGYARGSLEDLRFTKHPQPVLGVSGGGEMPRVFRKGGAWHLFYHHFGKDGYTWQHHVSDNGIEWRLFDPFFFHGHRGGGPRDLMMVYGMNGSLLPEPKMLAAATTKGVNKLWVYRLAENDTQPGFEESKTGRVYDTLESPFINPEREIGDPMPVYMDGMWHLYTLAGDLSIVHHLTSTDLARWTEHQPAMTGGDIATGTVLKHDGKYYFFYTIASKQRLWVVVSDNPWRFDRSSAKELPGPDERYQQNHYRDPYVFFNREAGRWWMLVESGLPDTHAKFKSTIALLTSYNLVDWELGDPLFSPRRSYASCPQLTPANGKWYLTFLDRSNLYRVADSSRGPFLRGERWEYNNWLATAGSRIATDGKRFFSWTFLCKRFSPEDLSIGGYGGEMPIGRELVFDGGRVWTKPIPEVIAVMRARGSDEDLCAIAKTLQGQWRAEPKENALYCLDEQGGAVGFGLSTPTPDFYFECDIVPKRQAMVADVIVRGGMDGYRIGVYPSQHIFEIRNATKEVVFTSTTFDFPEGEPINLKIFVMNQKIDAFLNDKVNLSTWALKRKTGLALELYDSPGVVRNAFIHYYRPDAERR